jgi:hypothetical protein
MRAETAILPRIALAFPLHAVGERFGDYSSVVQASASKGTIAFAQSRPSGPRRVHDRFRPAAAPRRASPLATTRCSGFAGARESFATNSLLANSRRGATRGSRPALLFARASEAVGLSDCVCPEAVGFRRAWTAVSPDETVTSAGLTPRGPRERSGAERGSRGGCVSGEAQRDGVACRCGCMREREIFFDRRAARWYVRPGELVHDQRSRFGCWPSCLSLFSLSARTTVPAGAARRSGSPAARSFGRAAVATGVYSEASPGRVAPAVSRAQAMARP